MDPDFYSVQPFKIEVTKQINNEQAVLKTYGPWIKLLLAIEESNLEQKNEIGTAIGRMIHRPKGMLDKCTVWGENGVIPNLSERKRSYFTFDFQKDDENKEHPCIKRYHEQGEDVYYSGPEFADFLNKEYKLDVNISQ